MAENEISINIKTLDARVFTLSVDKNIPVPELKNKISEKTNVSAALQRVIFQGKVLKDEHTLSVYGVKDGQTLHMVERPPQQPSDQQAPAAAQAPPQQAQGPVPRRVSQGRTIVNLPNVVMGTFTVPDGQHHDINQIVSNVLATIGIAPAPGTAQAQPAAGPVAPADPFARLSNLINTAEVLLPRDQPNANADPPPLVQGNVETLGAQLLRVHGLIDRAQPQLHRLATLLTQEHTLSDPTLRAEAQQLATRLSAPTQQLGALLNQVAPFLNNVRMGEAAGAGQVAPNPHPPHGNIAIHIHQTEIAVVPGAPHPGLANGAPAAFPGQNPGQPGAPQGIVGIDIPIMVGTPQGGPAPANSNPAAGAPLPQGQAFAANGQPQNRAQDFANLMNNMVRSINPQQVPGQPPAASSNPQQATAQFLGPFMQQFGVPPQQAAAVGAPQQPGAAPSFGSTMMNAVGTASHTVNNTVPQQAPAGAGQPLGTQILSQLYNAMGQAISNPSSQASTNSLGSLMRTVSTNLNLPDEDEGPLEDLLQVVTDTLTLPDMLRVFNGDIAPLQTVHAPVNEHLRNTILHGDVSEESVRRFADEIANSLQTSLNETVLPAEVVPRLRRDHDLVRTAVEIVRRNMISLLNTILATYQITNEQPYPFAAAIRQWNAAFVQEIVLGLADCLDGGVPDATRVIQRFLEQRLTSMGPEMATMGSAMVSSYITRTFSNHAQPAPSNVNNANTSHTSNSNTTTATTTTTTATINTDTADSILAANPPGAYTTTTTSTATSNHPATSHAPTTTTTTHQVANAGVPTSPPALSRNSLNQGGVPPEWAQTIAADEQAQANAQEQRPLSDSYISGSTNKRRKTEQAATSPQSVFDEHARAALSDPNSNSNSRPEEPSRNEQILVRAAEDSLSALYIQTLSNEIAERLAHDPDYDPARFPNIAEVFGQPR